MLLFLGIQFYQEEFRLFEKEINEMKSFFPDLTEKQAAFLEGWLVNPLFSVRRQRKGKMPLRPLQDR